MTSPQELPQSSRSATVLLLLRSACHLAAFIAITVWGFVSWPLPFPGVLTGLGFLVATVIIWALFLSPRPVLRTDRFGQALVELLLIAAAVAAVLDFGWNWILAAVLGLFAATVGYLASTAPR
ncbi:DUF2568 domain-containing protein [Leucobacter sp. GX24907]